MDFITRSLDGSDNLHAMAIGTYVLAKSNHDAKVSFVQRLDAMAVNEGCFVMDNLLKNLCIFLVFVFISRWNEMVE